VAKHLHALKKANLLDSNRYGRWAYYCLQKTEDTRALVEFLRMVVPRKVCQVELTRLQERLTMRKNGRCVIGPANQNGSDE
jgi:DNA-binding transcriptional ArsR family regulator